MKLSLKPKKARVIYGAAESWWYEDKGGIVVVVHPRDLMGVQVSITRAQLAGYLKRSAKEGA